MTYRVFYIVADNGKMDLGAPKFLSADSESLPRSGPAYKRGTLEKQITLLKGTVARSCHAGAF